MLRVLFCLNGADAVNGPNVWLTRHIPLLASKGMEPMVLYLHWDLDAPCLYRRLLETAGIKTTPVRLNSYLEDNVLTIAKTADSLGPDVFAPNYSVPGYFAARFLRESGVFTIGTLHSDDPYYHDIIDLFVTGPLQWRLSGVVTVSEYLRAFTIDRINGEISFLHAPYGAPMPPNSARWMPQRFRMVYSGRFIELQKRIRRVVAAMEAATLKVPAAEGVLYGEGPERPQLEQALLGWRGRIRIGGLLSPSEMQGALLDAQAFVLLSDFEGLSIALMEAMACGLVPIVTPMRSGVSDLVEDGVTGMIVPPDDPSAFAEAVEKLATDELLWQRMSNAARRVVVEGGYTAEHCADRWVKFLGESVTLRDGGKHPIEIPRRDQLDLPPRSTRLDGIRIDDRRIPWGILRAAVAADRPLFLWGASLGGKDF